MRTQTFIIHYVFQTYANEVLLSQWYDVLICNGTNKRDFRFNSSDSNNELFIVVALTLLL